MKKLALAFVLIAISICAVGQITPYKGAKPFNGSGNTNAGNNSQNFTKNTFDSKEESSATRYNGTAVRYIPSDLRSYNINPVDGVTSTLLPLETFATAKMPTKNGIQWVVLFPGDMCRFALDRKGRTCDVPYALDACGNEIMDFEYLPDLSNQQMTAEVPCNNCPPVSRIQKNPCPNCPPQKEYANVYSSGYNTGYSNLNNYSNRAPKQPYCPPQNYNNQRNGMPIWAKSLIGAAVVGGLSYVIFKKNPHDPTDQKVITLDPTIGMTFAVHF